MNDTPNTSPETLRRAIVDLAAQRGADKSVCPSEVARHLAGKDEKVWRLLMKPLRAQAVSLAHEGEVTITRKGKPVDPDNFRGVYRIRFGGTTTPPTLSPPTSNADAE